MFRYWKTNILLFNNLSQIEPNKTNIYKIMNKREKIIKKIYRNLPNNTHIYCISLNYITSTKHTNFSFSTTIQKKTRDEEYLTVKYFFHLFVHTQLALLNSTFLILYHYDNASTNRLILLKSLEVK